MTHRVLLQNLRTGRVTAELPAESATAVEILNAPGSLTVSMPLSAGGTSLRPGDVTERSAAAILLRDDTVVGFGIIETTSMDVASNTVTLGCLGWHHYLRNLYLRHDAVFIGWDQAGIVAWLAEYATAKSGALATGTTRIAATGRARDRSYLGWERHSIGELIEDLSAVIDGFNFRYEPVVGAEGYTVDMLLQYPATGRTTNYVFEVGGNVELLDQEGDGSGMANSVEMIGSGQGPEAPIVTATDVDVLGTTPLWEAVETHSDVTRVSTLQEKAQRRLTMGRSPVRVPTLRIGADVEPRLGTYHVGDRVRVRGSYGLLDVDADYLITQTSYDVGEGTVAVSTVPVAVLQ